jgi:ABC-2 type transport system ATP-binding protein
VDSVIECYQLEKNYGSKKVLKGIDLKVSAGTIYALLGTNGAGKTTLIRTLLGLIPKSSGEVRVLGAEPYKIGPRLRQRIGYVSEEQGLYNWMTVAEIIKFCKSFYSQWNDRLINRYLVQFNLDRRARIGTLSKGQTVKLALLLTIAPEPELLILDEPMSGLDPLAQYEFLQVVIREINLEGRTVFFSTHNLADVETVAKQIAIVNDGVIRAAGGITEVCSQIKKIRLMRQPLDVVQELQKIGVVVCDNSGEKALLIAADASDRIAVTGENIPAVVNSTTQPVSLQEAFLYFCAGGSR